MRRPTFLLALVAAALLAAMAATPLLTRVPPERTANTPAQFDADRAMRRLSVLLAEQQPHPADTAANDRVRQRLVAMLSGMGYAPLVRDQVACNELYKSRGVSCARVRNVIALAGPPAGKALLLGAHYDSTPTGPGVGDDGIGVATLLEVAEHLRRLPPRRPVILLFDEGEELGLIGARAFLSDPLSRNVDALLNFEARGVRGPVNMFETSRPNGAAVGIFQRAVAHPVANSLSTDVYRLMPNYTNVNTLAERHWLTLNFAPIGNETRYHSPGDDLAALDRATLQHMGDQALAAARALDQGTPNAVGETIFMNVGGRTLIVLPLLFGLVVLIGCSLAFAWLVLRGRYALRSAGVVLGSIAGSTGLAWVALELVGAFRQEPFWRAHPAWSHLGVSAAAMAVALILLATLGRRAGQDALRSMAWLVFLMLGALIAIAAPGGIIFFLLPPLAVLAGIVVRRWWRRAPAVGGMSAVIILYGTWGAMLGLLQELLNSGPLWAFAPLGALILVPALIEAKPLIDRVSRRAVAALAAIPLAAAWIAAAAAPAYSADRQQRFVIEHVTDTATGKASWSVLNGKAALGPAFNALAQWRWAETPYSEAKRWVAPAPTDATLEPPAIERVADTTYGRERLVTVRLRPNGALRTTLLAPEDSHISAAGTDGFVRPVDQSANGETIVSCFGRSCDGLVLQLRIAGKRPIAAKLVGSRPGLPSSAAPLLAARPVLARPQYAPNQTIVVAHIRL